MQTLKGFLIFGFLVSVVLLLSGWQQKTKIFSRAFGPQTTVHYALPVIRWEVWPDGDSKVTQVALTLNGKETTAKYVPGEKSVVCETPEPLSGTVEVAVVLTIDDRARFSKKWTFDISPNAVAAPRVPSATQLALLAQMNGYRKKLGLEPCTFDPRLLLAAEQHVKYLEANQMKTHLQISGKPSFLGSMPMDRAQAFGWVQGIWEGLGFDFRLPDDGLRVVFDAPYHRTSFMQPGAWSVGIAAGTGVLCVDGQVSDAVATVVSPADGQTEVPINWENPEKPDPLRIWPDARRPIGYAIVFQRFDPNCKKLLDVKAKLTSMGKDVPFLLNSPANDELCTTNAFLLPKDPLEPGRTYTVTVEATDDKGLKLDRTWSFTTAKH